MKKIIFFFLVFIVHFSVFSQNNLPEKMAERVNIQRIAFITQRLSLTETEAQQFWPIWNEFTNKLQQIRKQPKLEKTLEDMSDAEVEKLVSAQYDRETSELDLKKEYLQKLKKVLSIKKIAKLYRAEKDFRAELVKQLQNLRDMKDEKKRLRRE